MTTWLVPGDAWHPLDHTPAPEYVPSHWIGPHVGLRLVEALRTLQRMPINGSPKAFGSAWPAYAIEFADISSFADDPEWKQQEAGERNRIKLRPSSIKIARMETAIAWPARYLGDSPQLLRTVQMVVLVRSRHGDMARAAKRLDLPGRIVRRWNREGLDLIAAGLRCDAVPVF